MLSDPYFQVFVKIYVFQKLRHQLGPLSSFSLVSPCSLRMATWFRVFLSVPVHLQILGDFNNNVVSFYSRWLTQVISSLNTEFLKCLGHWFFLLSSLTSSIPVNSTLCFHDILK